MEAQFNLAYLYRTGNSDSVVTGTESGAPARKSPARRRSQKVKAVDMHKAFALYLQAAEQGHKMVRCA